MKSALRQLVFPLGLWLIQWNAFAQSALQTQLTPYIHYVVAKDGSGNYTTVQAAINAVPDKSTTSQVIFVKKGTYNEKVEIPSTKTHITLIGEDVNTTIIAHGDYSGSGKLYNGIITSSNGTAIGTSTSHTLFAAADDFTMMNITVTNTAGDVGQAVALNANADRQFYYHCKITGHQDTYLTWAAKRYYHKDCYIEGAVDFIFGGGVALFDSCQLNAVRSGISYTAASTGQNFKFGYVFNNCKLTANAGVTGIFLGRPWYPYCQVVFLNSEEPSALDPAGWSKWGGNTNDQTCYYAEYKNCGAGSSTTNRATWTHQLTSAQAAAYNIANIFDKSVNPSPYSANWLPVPDNDPIYKIIKKNTTRFITSACFSSGSGPTTLSKQGAGSSNQTITIGAAIVPYSFAWTNASSVTVSGMPAGVVVDINNTTQIVSISGTPTKTGVFNFTVTTVGGHPDSTKKGSITVNSLVTDLSAENMAKDDQYYPNPFTTSLTLTMKGDFSYHIYSLDGIEQESGKGTDRAEIGSQLSPSIYILKTQNSNRTTVQKISKTN